ncbi:MAG: aldehyde dehydrogenase family protein [Gammaproteobacteria bacterium]|nr:aldehyde dehydrogenase family protein [Gammaproteobacteria bacterium]
MLHKASSPAGVIEVLAPFDRSIIAEVETANADHIDQAMNVAYSLYRDKDSWLPLYKRIEILEKTAQIMVQKKERLAAEAAQEGGKPLVDSKVEVTRAIDGIHLCIETLKTDQGEIIPMGVSPSSEKRIAITQKEPIGVVVAVSAFNHPLNLIVHQVAAAVAAGCPVIVKPAEDTPLSCLNFVNILWQAGLPTEWCQAVIPESIAVAEKLVTDERVGFFTFIGSAKVGWMLRSKLAPGVRCALEHGGAAPVIMAEDTDVATAVQKLGKGGYYHAGQVCVSVQRVFAHKTLADSFIEQLASYAKQQRIGDPKLEKTDVGPLIRPAEVDRISSWVSEAKNEGAQCITGGNAISETCYECTVLASPSVQSKVSTAEIFGPVVCVYEYDDLDLAIQQANALPFSFQASVFTNSLDTAMRVYKRIDASAVMLNDHTAFRIDGMPFAGLKQSGLGVGGIPYTIEDMQVNKMLVMNSPEL